jgi:hypothetical protein
MNKPIDRLFARALDQTVSETWTTLTSEQLARLRDKFAELIVQECAQVCADRGKHHDGLYSAWASDCSERIEKHFGVKE